MEEAAADLISDIVRDRHLNSPHSLLFFALPLHEKVRFIVSIPTYILRRLTNNVGPRMFRWFPNKRKVGECGQVTLVDQPAWQIRRQHVAS